MLLVSLFPRRVPGRMMLAELVILAPQWAGDPVWGKGESGDLLALEPHAYGLHADTLPAGL